MLRINVAQNNGSDLLNLCRIAYYKQHAPSICRNELCGKIRHGVYIDVLRKIADKRGKRQYYYVVALTAADIDIPKIEDKLSFVVGIVHLSVCTVLLAIGSYTNAGKWVGAVCSERADGRKKRADVRPDYCREQSAYPHSAARRAESVALSCSVL